MKRLLPVFFATALCAQTPDERITSFNALQQLQENNPLYNLSFRNVGPTIMSGRVTDLDVDPQNTTHFYVAFASGGLWETKNNGRTFSPLFDKQPAITIGDIAVNWSTGRIWVGTGENNSSRSSYAGTGLYYSDNNGKDWKHAGLEKSHHISRILLQSGNDAVLVAVIGSLFTYNNERGIFITSDAGKTWKQSLFINEKTGVIDMVKDADNAKHLYAAAWQRERKPWNFTESGPGSGIYESNDAGQTWKLITIAASGFPQGDGVGRIGLTAMVDNTIYAFLDNQTHREKKEDEKKEGLTSNDFKGMKKETFLALDDKLLEEFMNNNAFPKTYNVKLVKSMVKKDKILPEALYEYLEDANSKLFNTPIKGAELYRSDDGGATWKKTHEDYLDDLVFTYGYYFGQAGITEKNKEHVYISAFYVIHSTDGGKTFKKINGDNQHVDHHALWINPLGNGHLINGNDGGINISYDDGATWVKCVNPAVGQFYTVNVDMAQPFNIYGGLQDNGVWVGSSQYKPGFNWEGTGRYPWEILLGGDGMQVMVDPRDNMTVYTGYQFGHYFRIDRTQGKQTYLTPKHELGEKPMRFNWQTPIWLSQHSADVLYYASNRVFRSLKKGEELKPISGDLTNGAKEGDVSYGTITCLHESPMKFGLLYAGTDDGRLHYTKDGGNNWKEISKGLPAGYWVRRVWVSAYKESRVYVCLNGHVQDDFKTMVFVSEDFGASWKPIINGLPQSPVNVIKEDAEKEDLLYLGNDMGIFISMDRGASWKLASTQMPNVPVHDLVIHPRDGELVAATHGRSIYVADIKPLRKSLEVQQEITWLDSAEVMFSKSRGMSWSMWDEPESTEIKYAVWSKTSGNATLTVKDAKGLIIYASNIALHKGINYVPYDLTVKEDAVKTYTDNYISTGAKEIKRDKTRSGKTYVLPGMHKMVLTMNGKEIAAPLTVVIPEK